MCQTDTYSVLGCEICLQYSSEAVARTFRHLLSGFPAADAPPSSAPYEIHEDSDKGVYLARKEGSCLGKFSNLLDLVSFTEWKILQNVLREVPFLGIHAGVVAREDRTILFPGSSGVGKTSIVLGLVLQGWTFLSDEIAPVQKETCRVHPFPRVINLKREAFDMFRTLDRANVLNAPGTIMNIDGVSCVTPKRFNLALCGFSAKVDLIVFPAYEKGSQTSIAEISRAKCASLLMQHTANLKNSPGDALKILGTVAEGARCFQLRSGSLDASLELVTDLCEQR